MHQGSRTILKNFIRLLPAAVLIVATINTMSCNSPGLLTLAGNSGSPTPTPTPGTGALGFVSNFADGKVASFTRKTTTGVLKRTGTIAAGMKKGPKGLAVSSGASFLYVANNADDNIYEYSVNQTNGTLTPLTTPSISNGGGSAPDEIAVNPAGTFLFVTGSKDGTVTTYAIDTSTGQLTQNKTKVTGLVNPFGIAVDSTGAFAFVADNGAGLVYSYGINTTTGALTKINSVFDLGSPGGMPGFIALDPAGTFIYVTDPKAGQLAVLGVSAGTLSFSSLVPSGTSSRMPLGIGYSAVSSVGNFIFTSNQGTATMWSFPVPSPGSPSTPVEFGGGDLNLPTGVVVDPQNLFLYTTNQLAGTVSQFSLGPTCFPAGPCFVRSVATDPNGNASGPFGIILAN
jgi:6-phosphogluconolactonase (cycloisomerase 2 family)